MTQEQHDTAFQAGFRAARDKINKHYGTPEQYEKYRAESFAALAPDATQTREAELVAALQPFGECAEQIGEDESDEEWAKFRLLIGDYRRARAALNGRGGA